MHAAFHFAFGVLDPPVIGFCYARIVFRRWDRWGVLTWWLWLAFWGVVLSLVPGPHFHNPWLSAVLGTPGADWWGSAGSAVSGAIAIAWWWWRRRKDRIRAALRSMRERERLIIAGMVKTLKGRQRVPARRPLPNPT